VSTTPADKFGLNRSRVWAREPPQSSLEMGTRRVTTSQPRRNKSFVRFKVSVSRKRRASARAPTHYPRDASSVSRTKLSRQQSIVRCSSISRPTALIRVSSGSSAFMTLKTDEYVDFIDTEPSRENPGKATREFVAWLASKYDRTSLIAWNGQTSTSNTSPIHPRTRTGVRRLLVELRIRVRPVRLGCAKRQRHPPRSDEPG